MDGLVRGGRRDVGGLQLGYRRLQCGRGNQLSGPSNCCLWRAVHNGGCSRVAAQALA
jgi:hypothetical protein